MELEQVPSTDGRILTNKPGRFSPLRAKNDLLQACFTALAETSRARPGNFDKVAPSKPWAIGIINARDTFIAPAERGKFDRSQPRMGHEKEKQAIRARGAAVTSDFEKLALEGDRIHRTAKVCHWLEYL